MTTTTTIATVVIDCADPRALAAFYARLTGWTPSGDDPGFVTLEGGPVMLAFQRVDGYRGPGWPGPAKHAHLDLAVPDVESAVRRIAELGGAIPAEQPGGGEWTVALDPEGHPFCLTRAA
ncbi:VOC family protein [Actinomadura sp. ATCC 31491]|uniref:VOC family protein n=1 Tax=Actinomadura luzonensis TaxID=2805427 RepID=A0ABT0G3N4_9ACTN|nr:VOC family protein [Actinomadura luzonensis]MCK2219190.1 VOC family protein [Actinomadura luzonensis]